jgi:hypothetical protein
MMRRGESIPAHLQHLADAAIANGFSQAVN